MTWPELAAKHFGHKAVLRDVQTLECVQCQHKLLLPLRPDVAPTSTPPRWKPDRDDLQPMPSWFKTRVQAVRGTTPTTSEETP